MNTTAIKAVDRAIAAVDAIPAACGTMHDEQLDALARIGADLRNLRAQTDGSAAPRPACPALAQLRRKIMRGAERRCANGVR